MVANNVPDAIARATVKVMERMGKIMDENHDNKITKEEYMKHSKDMAAAHGAIFRRPIHAA